MATGFKKKLNTPKTRKVKRKKDEWTVKAAPGPHPGEKSVPLKVALRDHLKLVEYGEEAEKIIKKGKIEIDGETVTDGKYPIGFMDVLTIEPTEQHYRAGYDEKGRMEFKEINKEEADHKLGQVKRKQKTRNGKTQTTLHDGKNLLDIDADVGDSLKITLPDKEIEKKIKLKEGNQAYITSGKHAGEILEITEILPGTSQRRSLVTLGEITTPKENVFPIGKNKPEIKIGGKND